MKNVSQSISGTTDTYFSRSIASVFQATYKELVNRPYDNLPKNYESIAELQANEPTILLQLFGDTSSNKAFAKGTPRLVDALDHENPLDILLAIPPEHYFEYNGKYYQSRFYVDETGHQSIMGANTLMGHNILFDLERLRLGIAESTCNYTAVTSKYPIPPPTLPEGVERSYDMSSEDKSLCTTRTCQYGTMTFASLFVVFFARRILRGKPRNYQAVLGNEEELPPVEDKTVASDGYRDSQEA